MLKFKFMVQIESRGKKRVFKWLTLSVREMFCFKDGSNSELGFWRFNTNFLQYFILYFDGINQRKPLTCHESLTNLITCRLYQVHLITERNQTPATSHWQTSVGCIRYTSLQIGINLTTLYVYRYKSYHHTIDFYKCPVKKS